MQYRIVVNVHWIPTFELASSCHKRPGLLTYFFYYSENDSKLKDWINFGIYWKNLLSHSRPWPWVCGLGLGLACLWPWPWLTCLGVDTSVLVNIPDPWRFWSNFECCSSLIKHLYITGHYLVMPVRGRGLSLNFGLLFRSWEVWNVFVDICNFLTVCVAWNWIID